MTLNNIAPVLWQVKQIFENKPENSNTLPANRFERKM